MQASAGQVQNGHPSEESGWEECQECEVHSHQESQSQEAEWEEAEIWAV